MRGSVLIQRSVSEYGPLQVTFGGEQVEQLCVTDICLYNIGREPIRAEDVASTDPIRIEPTVDGTVLSCEVAAKTRDAIPVSISQRECEGSGVTVSIGFLDFMDGIRLRVMHTGTWWRDLVLRGTVLGVPPGIRYERADSQPVFLSLFRFLRQISPATDERLRRALPRSVVLVGFFMIALACLAWGLAAPHVVVGGSEAERGALAIVAGLVGLFYAAMGFGMIPRTRCPPRLWRTPPLDSGGTEEGDA